MPVRVVDLLESIEIEEHDGQRPVVAPGERDRIRQPIVEELTIGQPGHRVVHGPSPGISLSLLRNRQGRLRIGEDFPGFGQCDLGLCEIVDPLRQCLGQYVEVLGAFLAPGFRPSCWPVNVLCADSKVVPPAIFSLMISLVVAKSSAQVSTFAFTSWLCSNARSNASGAPAWRLLNLIRCHVIPSMDLRRPAWKGVPRVADCTDDQAMFVDAKETHRPLHGGSRDPAAARRSWMAHHCGDLPWILRASHPRKAKAASEQLRAPRGVRVSATRSHADLTQLSRLTH